MCVYSNSRNDVSRVAQRYGTIAAHTRRRASVHPEKKIYGFTIYGRGGHVGHVTHII